MTFENTERPETKWVVITGAPCSGKTAVIRQLEQRGYRVIHEVARSYIDSQLKKGRTIPEIKADEWAFEHHILIEKCRIEARLSSNELIFLDRAVPDSIAYYRLNGLSSAEPFKKARQVRYQKVFLLERLAFLPDPVRSENEQTARRLEQLIEESYRALDYDIIQVPLLSIAERTDFILKRL